MKRAVLSSLLALALAAPGLPAIAQEQKASHRGPPRERVEQTLSLVDYRRIGIEPGRIMLPPGMAITLNGIAQGYITDRVADLLGARGWTNVLIDLGELRGLGGHPDGRPWRTALTDPVDAGRIVTTVPLSEKCIATSCGAATRFEASGRHHHLFSPASGRSANTYEAVTVAAERATLADALSTALFVAPSSAAASILSELAGVQAFLWSADGSVSHLARLMPTAGRRLLW